MTITFETIVSWHSGKAVQDNIVELWLCVDCGVNTNPGHPSGPEMRIDLALKGVSQIKVDRDSEVYHVKDKVWFKAGMRNWNGCLCVGCLEQRLGRQLQPNEFSRHDKERFAHFPCTERLLNRRGFANVWVNTKNGPREFEVALKDAERMKAACANGGMLTLDEDEEEEV